jgi:hypothetical protein
VTLVRVAASIALVAALIGACRAGGAASPSPPGFEEIFGELARRGATVSEIVSGDPGCDDPSLVANAVRFTVVLSDGTRRQVHLFGFRNDVALANAAGSLERCRADFAGRVEPGATIGATTAGPYYAFGAPWSAELEVLLREAALPRAGG